MGRGRGGRGFSSDAGAAATLVVGDGETAGAEDNLVFLGDEHPVSASPNRIAEILSKNFIRDGVISKAKEIW